MMQADKRAFEWADARGVRWRIEVRADHLWLDNETTQTEIPASEWSHKVSVDAIGDGAIVRFDLKTRQVGFLVPLTEGRALANAMGGGWLDTASDVPGNVRVPRSVSSTETDRASLMNGWALAGLFLAVISFLPWLGFGAALASVTALFVSVRQSRRISGRTHVVLVARVSLVILAIGLVTNSLSVGLLHSDSGAISEQSIRMSQAEMSMASKIIAVAMVLLSLTVHEAAHALVAWWCGDTGPLEEGRVTLNPLPHIDPLGSVLLPAMLAYWGGVVFGFARPVRVTLRGTRNPRLANILISSAGPLSNALLGLLFLSLHLLLGCILVLACPDAQVGDYSVLLSDVYVSGIGGAPFIAALATCLKWGFFINFLLFFLNMIPLPPLDGSHILRSVFPRTVGSFYRKLGPFSLIIFLALIFTGVFNIILMPAMFLIQLGSVLVFSVTGLL